MLHLLRFALLGRGQACLALMAEHLSMKVLRLGRWGDDAWVLTCWDVIVEGCELSLFC